MSYLWYCTTTLGKNENKNVHSQPIVVIVYQKGKLNLVDGALEPLIMCD